jgi:hypothetical protein
MEYTNGTWVKVISLTPTEKLDPRILRLYPQYVQGRRLEAIGPVLEAKLAGNWQLGDLYLVDCRDSFGEKSGVVGVYYDHELSREFPLA